MGEQMSTLGNKLFRWYVYLVLIWVHIALLFDITMITLHFMGREDLSKQLISKITNYGT